MMRRRKKKKKEEKEEKEEEEDFLLGLETGSASSGSYLSFFADVPREGDGVVGDFLHVADGVEALLVVGWRPEKSVFNTTQIYI